MSRRYTHTVKYALVCVAGVLTVWLLFGTNSAIDYAEQAAEDITAPAGAPSSATASAQLAQTARDEIGVVRMENPRFSGEDIEGRSWVLEADEAVQTGMAGKEHIELNRIRATAYDARQNALIFKAQKGVYMQEKSHLDIMGDITLSGLGYTLNTQGLAVDLKQRMVSATAPVALSHARGKLEAPVFYTAPGAQNVHFRGGVKGFLLFQPQTKGAAQ